jgi:hypothetical protein
LHGQFTFFCGAPITDVEAGTRGAADVARAVEALAPWGCGSYLNLAERRIDPSTAYEPDAWARLCTIRASVDPEGLFLANHAIPSVTV